MNSMKSALHVRCFLGVCLLLVASTHAQVIKVACIGDSITQGSGSSAYPVVLGTMLGTNFQTRNFGVSGRTLLRNGDFPYWREQAFRDATNYAPNIVTIKLGTNDSKPQNWRFKQQFARDLADMVDVFANLPSKPKVLLCFPVPAYGVNFEISPEVIKNEIIPLIKQVAKEKDLMTVDLYTALSGRSELFPDFIHPSDHGHVLIARTLQGAVLAASGK